MATVGSSRIPQVTKLECVIDMDEFYVFLGMMAVTLAILGVLAIYYGVKECLTK